jgi:hypothetical protein
MGAPGCLRRRSGSRSPARQASRSVRGWRPASSSTSSGRRTTTSARGSRVACSASARPTTRATGPRRT